MATINLTVFTSCTCTNGITRPYSGNCCYHWRPTLWSAARWPHIVIIQPMSTSQPVRWHW